MKKQITIFETLIQSVDSINGTVNFKGQYADATKDLEASALIPYIARDIFLAQKDEVLLKRHLEVKVMSGPWPHIAIVFADGISSEDFKIVEPHLTKILWNYNYFFYVSRKDKFEQRFFYSFLIRSMGSHSLAAA